MANRITLAKTKLNVDDAGLAELLGVHRTTVARMERRDEITGPAGVLLDQILADPAPGSEPGKTEAAA